MELTRLRGFQDVLGAQARALAFIEQRARELIARYGFSEIRLPVLERSELYRRTSGETSDIVTKQMYTFHDSDEAQTLVALRPEGTPGVVRAYIEAGLDRTDPEQRFFYSGPIFRRERPQKGRYRQHYQFGVEILGRSDPACDAELIVMIDDLRAELGVDLNFEVNSIGDEKCRPAFRDAVLQFGKAHWNELCEDCHERLERNPLRLLDCKTDAKLAEQAPRSLDFLCEDCRKHFESVMTLLEKNGVSAKVNPRIVRGLDYYVRTAFEVTSSALGAQATVIGGGRYDGLVQALGGASVPGIGFGMGLERMALVVEAAGRKFDEQTEVAVIALGEAATAKALALSRELRDHGRRVEMLSPERSLKAQLKRADRLGVRYAVIIGEDELKRGAVQLRDLKLSDQREVAPAELLKMLTDSPRQP